MPVKYKNLNKAAWKRLKEMEEELHADVFELFKDTPPEFMEEIDKDVANFYRKHFIKDKMAHAS
jgi:hypothetical protein